MSQRMFHWIPAMIVSVGVMSAAAQADSRDMQYFRYPDQRGINVFETPKEEGVPFTDLNVRVGGEYALQYQSLNHSNNASPKLDTLTGANLNQLMSIGNDFNLATANLDIDVQLADGVRSQLRTYMSSRHHTDTYVKDGYLLIDKLDFIEKGFLQEVMDVVTLKIGHMEVNYGDAHFRRTDNAEAIYNPFVGNYILDSFSTEVGMEAYVRRDGWLGMLGMTNGKLNQTVANTQKDGPSLLGKLGYDKQINEDLRLRLTGSVYHTSEANPTRLYGGDRAGSRYYFVMENTQATSSGNFTSGGYNPLLNEKLTATMLNAFVQYKGLEFFGTFENAKGQNFGESSDRTVRQIAGEALYHFGSKEQFYAGVRQNQVKGPESFTRNDITIDRTQVAAGWFWTKNLLAKLEYVTQEYKGFSKSNILNEGKFDGFMVETVVAF